MALSVATLAGFPSINTTFQRSAGTPTDAATFTFTNGVYTPGSTTYVAGILDQQGLSPSRVFFSDNNTGGGTTGTLILPTLVSITQISAHGQSLQELPSTTFEVADAIGYAGFLVIMTPAEPSMDSGGRTGGVYGGPNSANNGISTLIPAQGYPSGIGTGPSPVAGYPQPQMRYYLTMSAMLIIASTSTG